MQYFSLHSLAGHKVAASIELNAQRSQACRQNRAAASGHQHLLSIGTLVCSILTIFYAKPLFQFFYSLHLNPWQNRYSRI